MGQELGMKSGELGKDTHTGNGVGRHLIEEPQEAAKSSSGKAKRHGSCDHQRLSVLDAVMAFDLYRRSSQYSAQPAA